MNAFGQKMSLPFFLVTCTLTIHAIYASNNDTLRIGGNITDEEALVSSGGIFEVAFFTPGSSGNRHLGVRYKTGFPVFVWIANRHVPLTNSLGVLQFREPGILVLLNDTGGIVWSSTAPSVPLLNPVAQILDSGNLVVRDADNGSFDYPTDTYLPGMKLGWNLVTRSESYLSSWTSNDDPAPGVYSLHLDPAGYPQIVVKTGNGTVRFRAVALTGVQPSGPQGSTSKLELEMNATEVKYREDNVNGSGLWRSRLSQVGILQRYAMNIYSQDWFLYKSSPIEGDSCWYNFCGANSVCRTEGSTICECLNKFESRDPKSKVCIRRRTLKWSSTDVFLNYSGIELPDSKNSWFNDSIQECRDECLSNSSCTAYTELDIGSGGGKRCLFYSGGLMDIRNMSSDHQSGYHLYIRMDSSELENVAVESKKNRRVVLIASLTSGVGGVLLLLGLIALILYFRKRKNDPDTRNEVPYNASQRKDDSELPFFNLSTILKATDNFPIGNRLGEGGFGAVYRGMLDNGEEVAVKRLSKTSSQGIHELKNELILIAKLQHRNLVRLLGCCVEGEENMLIYEYMPNKSLNQILFDQTKSMMLDWRKRFNIINGIAKGLLYLHQDSRLRIIHRDLKAANILLDHDMNPRISDFGLARIFGGNETSEVTHKVVGTFGYMPPEYAGGGVFSVKSDVYSFGVLVLEVVSGKKTRGMISHGNSYLNLVGYVSVNYLGKNIF
ncbi:hypothetical protein ACS0TY_023548 [Phlomoides rotata]